MEVLKNYIDGRWVDSVSKETVDVLNPATGEVLAKVPFGIATVDDVSKAVEAAHKAYLPMERCFGVEANSTPLQIETTIRRQCI